jgi:hypothetical protein
MCYVFSVQNQLDDMQLALHHLSAVQVYLVADSLKEVDELGLTPPDITLDYVVKHT